MLLFALAGCGGGGGGGSSLYTLSATQSCMQHAGYQAQSVANPALPGSAGNLRVKLRNVQSVLEPTAPRGGVIPHVYVFLVFEKDAPSALAAENKAVDLAIKSLAGLGEGATRAYVRSGVGLQKNVFYYSPTGPLSQDERSKVAACLR